MKLLMIGCGGIGSYLIQELAECKKQGQLTADITIADNDMAEMNQARYQNFDKKDLGKNKAEALAKRWPYIKALNKRMTEEKQLKPYDTIILCADNDKVRHLVISHCWEHGKYFIDLRATGRRIFAMPKMRDKQYNLDYVEEEDMKEYSCQDKEDLKKGYVQKGHKIIAVIGLQMILNHYRKHNNERIIHMLV